MLALAVGWDVYQRTGNVVDLGLIGLAMFFPVLFLSIPAGVMADRVDRRVILVCTLLINSLGAIAIGVWFYFDEAGILPVLFLLVVVGSAQAFQNPAMSSTLPKIVPREIFSNAGATASSISKIAQLVGPIVGGFLIAFGGQVSYAITAFLCVVSAIAVAMIRADLRVKEREPITIAVLLGGFRFILSTPKVFAAMSIDLVALLFGGIMGILPVYAADILGVGAEGLGVMRAAPALGAFLVAIMLAAYRLPWAVGRSFFVSLAVFGLSILLFSISRNYWLSLAALAIYGAADMVSVYVRHTLIQLDTPDELRGRVSAVSMFSAGGSTQLGDFRAGIMAGMIGTPASVAVGGLVTLAAAAIWYRRYPELRKLVTF
jgi:MFS family permease